jgi:hypothetical protein
MIFRVHVAADMCVFVCVGAWQVKNLDELALKKSLHYVFPIIFAQPYSQTLATLSSGVSVEVLAAEVQVGSSFASVIAELAENDLKKPLSGWLRSNAWHRRKMALWNFSQLQLEFESL